MLLQLLFMSLLLGVSSFGCGMIPLAFALSKNHVERLSAVGTGLLLGAALAVIVPEGIETIVNSSPDGKVPTTKIALALLAGFSFMLLVEQLGIGHSHESSHDLPIAKAKQSAPPTRIEFDAELDDLERDDSGRAFSTPPSDHSLDPGSNRKRALPLTLGLVIHGLADGFALGVSGLVQTQPDATNTLSLVVFLALILHKAPTSLALTTSLLSSGLPRADCKKYLAFFSVSTPISTIASYLLFSMLGADTGNSWTGPALLLSGGSFLYVATVLQPVSHHSSGNGDLPRLSRVLLIMLGLFIPFALSALLGHGH
ncbi:Zinc/iron permease [Coprinopsis marcescibilis]|uniref:Zinc/iron permease n=1 Tax=Coprinopsis marcescibilis TaxID=230819 RepID=A0A5C3KX06_COPMA|nr:Zinc/iron permease [Coprinopsis marcescibilis]